MEKIYDISTSLIYRWIYKYSKCNKKGAQVVEMKDSNAEKIRQMEARIKELEQAVEDWHETHIGPETLIEYLGLNIEEYTACLKCSSILEELLIANGNN